MSQEASSVITEYLLDTQPGLAKVIASTTGGNTTRFVHDPMGIHSQENPNGDWLHIVKDGLGSVRQVFDDNLSELYAAEYAPYGEVWNSSGTEQTPFAFTGEMLDDNGLQYHRARYLDPSLGVWMSLDPLETANRYGYVDANPVNAVDPSGQSPNCQQEIPCTKTTFNYNRSNAAQYAIGASRRNVQGKILHKVDPLGFFYGSGNLGETNTGLVEQTGSGVFISEMLWRGGIPMILGENGSPDLGTQSCDIETGWRICPMLTGNTVSMTRPWRTHNARNSFSYFNPIPIPFAVSNQLMENIQTQEIEGIDLFLLQALLPLALQTGDIFHTEGGGNLGHSFLVVGWGPAVNCEEALDQMDSEVDPTNAPTWRSVPYVVDYSWADGAWRQDPRPRPFYCYSYENVSRGYFRFSGDGTFYLMPNTVEVPCDKQYELFVDPRLYLQSQ